MRLLTLAVVVCGLFGAPAALGTYVPPSESDASRVQPGLTDKPNIVVIYLDDTSPHDGRLWSDPNLTPTLYDLFVARGAQFPGAIGETPLCCPGRGGMLTGLHTHNHLVKVNDVRLFNPGQHIGRELKDVGYDTFMIGKYFNWSERLTPTQWQQHADGWTDLDVFMNPAGPEAINYYVDYTLFTKQGPIFYDDVHSTQMIAERAVAHIQATDPSTPIFQVLTPFNTHAPHIPLPQFANDTRCDAMPPWNPPNYNEADVSDKPPAIRALPLLPEVDGWPMVALCREMLGVDWMAKRVVDELTASGRIDNTVFVFTADNGMGWGEHRWAKKKMPYTTPVPLYVSWPARWGSEPRVISDGTSNIDLAPTFCELGGCTMGPYPTGQAGPDGVSLVPLLDGTVENLGRDALLETDYGTRPWSALRTTPSNPLGLWHYVEHASGFRELYSLSEDPWEMNNIAMHPATAELRGLLSARLAQLLAEGRVAPSPQRPDGALAVTSLGAFKGLNVYGTAPKANQTQKLHYVIRKSMNDFTARVTNHGTSPATFTVQGASTGTGKITVRYLVGEVDVTSQVEGGNYLISDVQPGTSVDLTIRFVVGKAPHNAKKSAVLTIRLSGDPGQVDVLKAVAIRGTPPAPPPPPPPPPTIVIDLSPP